jgi:hypothetical protein
LLAEWRKGKGESELLESLTAHNLCQKVGEAVSRQDNPPISNPPRVNDVSRRKHRSRCDHRAIQKQ